MTKKQFNCAWIIEHLPDSAITRRQLLEGILETLPANDRIARGSRELIASMDTFDLNQKQLSLEFQSGGNSSPDGNHNHKGDGK